MRGFDGCFAAACNQNLPREEREAAAAELASGAIGWTPMEYMAAQFVTHQDQLDRSWRRFEALKTRSDEQHQRIRCQQAELELAHALLRHHGLEAAFDTAQVLMQDETNALTAEEAAATATVLEAE